MDTNKMRELIDELLKEVAKQEVKDMETDADAQAELLNLDFKADADDADDIIHKSENLLTAGIDVKDATVDIVGVIIPTEEEMFTDESGNKYRKRADGTRDYQ